MFSNRTRVYSYGFNGQEKDLEIGPNENINTAENWQYDSRIGRRWNLDPKPQIDVSDYACFANNPILLSDPNGDTPGAGDPPTKPGTNEGETATTQYFPACKECTEYRTENWIWHKGGVNGSEAGWMSPENYQEEILKPVTKEFDAWVESNYNEKLFTNNISNYVNSMESSGLSGIGVLGGYSKYMKENPTVDGFERYIPIWGSGKQAYLDFSVGKYGWGTFNTVLAVTDVFLAKSVIQAPLKAMFNSGVKDGMTSYFGIGMSHEYGASVARWKGLGLDMSGFKHHWFLSQELMESFPALKTFGNQTWNLTRFSSQASHMRWAHGQMYGGIKYRFTEALYPFTSTPNWFKFGLMPSTTGRAIEGTTRKK